MTLHLRLRELAAARGADVFADPEELRAALDDYLVEDEVSTGELNLVVDAVRLGAVDRLRILVQQGGDVRSAAREAGASLARDRGTAEVDRSSWAVAVVGHALGLVPEPDVVALEPEGGRPTAGPPAQPSPAATPPPTFPLTAPVGDPVEPAVASGAEPSRRRTALLVVLALVALVGGSVAAWLVLGGNDTGKDAGEETGEETPRDVVERWMASSSCEAASPLVTDAAAAQLEELSDDGTFCDDISNYKTDYVITDLDEDGATAHAVLEGTQHYSGDDESVPDARDVEVTIELREVDDEWLISDYDWQYVE